MARPALRSVPSGPDIDAQADGARVPEQTLSVGKWVALIAALVFALSTSIAAGMFVSGSAAASGDYKTGVTQCPM